MLIQRNKWSKKGLVMKGRHKWGFISGCLFKEITFGVYMFIFDIPVRFENMREHQEEVTENRKLFLRPTELSSPLH